MKHQVGTVDRIAAAVALLLGLLALLLCLDFAIARFPAGLAVLIGLVAATAFAWYGLVGAGPARYGGFTGAALMLVLVVIFFIDGGIHLLQAISVVVLLCLAIVAARRAFSMKVPLVSAEAPSNPVLIFNPASGDGKAEKFSLADEATSRGIRPVELVPGSDLEDLVRKAVDDGADALAMAGGDGSQAVVASIAAELDLPYACIPAGTRNHFALDLGVDRDDVVGALDAFVDAGERRVDLAEVNGQTFVNNVSLGLYAEAVQKDGYREAKIKTLLDTLPEFMGSGAEGSSLSWRSPSGRKHHSGAAILVSNNQYRLGKAVGSGTRPKIDDGLLGIAVLADPVSARGRLRRFQKPWRDWAARKFEVGSDDPIAAGIDGEAVELEPPLVFRIKPRVLRVRISRAHPGASPSAAVPEGIGKVLVALAGIVMGRPPAASQYPGSNKRKED